MDAFDTFLNDTREAMSSGQEQVSAVLSAALSDHERFAAAIFARPKPWFFAADDTMTVFCTEGRPGNASAPHDHGTWSVLGCFDGSEESWWHEADQAGALSQVGSGVLRAGQTHSLPADAIHAVMNRWDQPNGVVHVYAGNFLANERKIWDPVTHESHPAGLTEPLAPSARLSVVAGSRPSELDARPAFSGTAFAAVTVSDLAGATTWVAEALGFSTLTTQDDSCAVDERFSYLIEPGSLTIIGLHATAEVQPNVGLHHLALRVPSLAQLERWREDLDQRGLNPSSITQWNFGTFIDVVGPERLTIRLFVPAVR